MPESRGADPILIPDMPALPSFGGADEGHDPLTGERRPGQAAVGGPAVAAAAPAVQGIDELHIRRRADVLRAFRDRYRRRQAPDPPGDVVGRHPARPGEVAPGIGRAVRRRRQGEDAASLPVGVRVVEVVVAEPAAQGLPGRSRAVPARGAPPRHAAGDLEITPNVKRPIRSHHQGGDLIAGLAA